MSKLFIILLIALIISPISSEDYKPPADSQLHAWWLSITFEQKITTIRNLDIIEHTTPEIKFPELTALLDDKGSLIIFPLNEEKAEIKIHYLHYKAEIPVFIIENFYKPNPWIGKAIIIGLSCFAGGFILGRILPK